MRYDVTTNSMDWEEVRDGVSNPLVTLVSVTLTPGVVRDIRHGTSPCRKVVDLNEEKGEK